MTQHPTVLNPPHDTTSANGHRRPEFGDPDFFTWLSSPDGRVWMDRVSFEREIKHRQIARRKQATTRDDVDAAPATSGLVLPGDTGFKRPPAGQREIKGAMYDIGSRDAKRPTYRLKDGTKVQPVDKSNDPLGSGGSAGTSDERPFKVPVWEQTPEDYVATRVVRKLLDRQADTEADTEWRRREAAADTSPLFADLDRFAHDVAPTLCEVGPYRHDDAPMFYRGHWHVLAGESESGKSWVTLIAIAVEIRRVVPEMDCLCCQSAICQPGHVRGGDALHGKCDHPLRYGRAMIVHFEEPNPRETYKRLRALGLTHAEITERVQFVNGETSTVTAERFARVVDEMHPDTMILILDGIGAACSLNGWNPNAQADVGAYVEGYVAPALRRGITVVSTGHVVKNPDRKDDRGAIGSVDWINRPDGGSFRIEPSGNPITRGKDGMINIFVDKDRHGHLREVAAHKPQKGTRWHLWGHCGMDATQETLDRVGHNVWSIALPKDTKPDTDDGESEEATEPDAIDERGAQIVAFLRAERKAGRPPRYGSANELSEAMAAAGIKSVRAVDHRTAVKRLWQSGVLICPEVKRGQSQPGELHPDHFDPEPAQSAIPDDVNGLDHEIEAVGS